VKRRLNTVRSGGRIAKTDEQTILPDSLRKAATELAGAYGISLDQFIAAAVAETIYSIRATETKRRLAPIRVNTHMDDEALLLGALVGGRAIPTGDMRLRGGRIVAWVGR
jgi:hypothetical protein